MIPRWLVLESTNILCLLIPYSPKNQPIYEERTSSTGLTSLLMYFRHCDLASDGFNLVALSYGAGSCSAAISAACHSLKDDCTDTVALGELM